MPRYDLMHWSERVRDQQTAYTPTAPAPTVAPRSPPRRSAKPRVVRPKPPRDEDAEHLLRLCREGRLFELQAWVAGGKPLAMPTHYRRTPLRVALDTGFHSLIEFLLQHESDQSAKDAVLQESCWGNQPPVMRLALQHGASVHAVSFQEAIETWDRDVVQLFLSRGADPVTNGPFARAFRRRVKAALGSYLDCKRTRPDLAERLQEQADMALRQACQDEDLYSQGYVALLERGLRQPSPALQRRMVKVLDLPPTALSPSVSERSVDADQLVAELSNLGYQGFRHLRRPRQVAKNPAAVLLSALRSERLEPRAAESLPWLVATFPDLDWHWLVVPRANALDLQNRLGFVVTLARQLAERMNVASSPVLREQEALVDRSRLVREDVFGRTTMTEAEKRWLRTTRSPEASHWNVLSSLTAEHLSHAG